MGTSWKQFLTITAVATAMLAVHAVAPSSADAWFWNNPPGRGAPEVDPSTLGSAIALAMGGLAVLSDRLRRR